MNEYKVEKEFGMSEYPTWGEFIAGAVFVVGLFATFWAAMVAFNAPGA